MLIQDTCGIGGRVVGIGVIHRDGTEDFKWLDEPVHNRITSVGLDHLLCAEGGSTGGFTSTGWSTGHEQDPHQLIGRCVLGAGTREGVLTYCKIGTGTRATSFTDTDLQTTAPGTGYSKVYKLDDADKAKVFTGTQVTDGGHYRCRVTYISDAVTSDSKITEFGVFGKYHEVYPMFARVRLQEPVNIVSGEKLMVTYELKFSHNTEAVHIDNFFDMLDANGDPLECDVRINSTYTAGTQTIGEQTDFSGKLHKYPYVNTSGDEVIDGNYSSGAATSDFYGHARAPYYYDAFRTYGDYDTVMYSTKHQEFGVIDSYLSKARSDAGTYTFAFTDYEGVDTNDKHRDVVVTMGQFNPAMLETTDKQDIYFMRYRGMNYKFGHYSESGLWQDQALRKWALQEMTFTFRTRYVTPDTLQADGTEPDTPDDEATTESTDGEVTE